MRASQRGVGGADCRMPACVLATMWLSPFDAPQFSHVWCVCVCVCVCERERCVRELVVCVCGRRVGGMTIGTVHAKECISPIPIHPLISHNEWPTRCRRSDG